MVRISIALLLFALAMACSQRTGPAQPVKHYRLTGKIVALDSDHQIATVDAEAIPGYMEAMTMDYPVQSKADFKTLHKGDRITATVDVAADDRYDLSDLHVQTPSGK